MPCCVVCGGNEFDVLAGCYYCTECNTQSQGIREQEVEDVYHKSINTSLAISIKKDKDKTTKNYGKQWSTYECFNIIINKQVEKLIELGASPKLKEVVFYLWATYLKNCEVAFVRNETGKTLVPRIGTFPRKRDILIFGQGQEKSPKISNNKKRTRAANNTTTPVVDVELSIDDTELSQIENLDSQIKLQQTESICNQLQEMNVIGNEEANVETSCKQNPVKVVEGNQNINKEIAMTKEGKRRKSRCTDNRKKLQRMIGIKEANIKTSRKPKSTKVVKGNQNIRKKLSVTEEYKRRKPRCKVDKKKSQSMNVISGKEARVKTTNDLEINEFVEGEKNVNEETDIAMKELQGMNVISEKETNLTTTNDLERMEFVEGNHNINEDMDITLIEDMAMKEVEGTNMSNEKGINMETTLELEIMKMVEESENTNKSTDTAMKKGRIREKLNCDDASKKLKEAIAVGEKQTKGKNRRINKAIKISVKEKIKKRKKRRRRILRKKIASAPQNAKAKVKSLKFVNYMSIEKTVAFCYLGLLLVEDNILLSDLIRWTKEDHFPYIGLSYLLPSSMILQACDWKLITPYTVPDLDRINKLCHKLALFLNVEKIPNKSLMPIIARFIIDLNLPKELISISYNLIHNKLPDNQWRSAGIPRYELQAMAIIIISLKLLFGLNDNSEKKLSCLGEELSKHLPEGDKPFVWNNWVEHMKLKLNFLSHVHVPLALFTDSDVYDVEKYKMFYHQVINEHWHPKDTSSSKYFTTNEFRTSLRKVFSTLSSEKETAGLCPPNIFPITTCTNYYKEQYSVCNFDENFLDDSVSYLINWKKYIEDPVIADIYVTQTNSEEFMKNCDDSDHICSFPYSQYWLSHFSVTEISYHSFKWLLAFGSNYVEVPQNHLYQEIIRIEKVLFKTHGIPKILPGGPRKNVERKSKLMKASLGKRK